MNEQNIFKNDNVTSNSAQLEILKKNFPNCFDKDGHFILDSFKEVIKENDLDFSDESYSLNWLGKSYAQLLRNEKAHTFIQPNHDHNNQEINKNSQNLLIKGDNLEVLKHLRNVYSEKIKMIYIDPPYNTGSDGFIYQDDRKFSKKELMHLAKVSEDEAKRILDFTAKGSNSHSAWLTFIYPRLYIARELLREDGVIFISIDDNEQAQLKLLCDEIFGEENFIVNFIWQKKRGGSNDSIHVALEHEYVIMFAKNKEALNALFQTYSPEYLKRYNQEDHISRYYWDTFKRKSGKQYYPITCPDGSILQYDEFGNEISWLRSEDRFYSDLKCGDVKLEKTRNDDWNVYFKQRLPKGKKPRSILIEKSFLNDSGSTSDGSDDLFKLFQVHVFNNPKPVKLLKNLLEIITTENDIILDFFAGSGTTTQAIMELNVEDNADRQFILVQLPEVLDSKKKEDKAAYDFCVKNKVDPTIFSITKARIEKAGEKIKQDNPEYTGDLGFKIFETAPLPDHYNNEVLELSAESQTEMFDGAKNDEQLLNAILTTWTLYDRIPLTSSLESLLIDDYNAQYSSEYNTLYLMQPNFTTQNTKTLINKIETDPQFVPEKIVIYGFNFDSKIQRELDEALKSYQNKKSLNIDLLVRYY